MNRKHLFETTTLTIQEIATQLGVSYQAIGQWAWKNYPKEYRSLRKRDSYSKSKMGDKNPMYGKTGDLHHNKQERTSDCKGYWLVLKPEWYTGRVKSKHVFEHHYVYCLDRGLTEVPAGMHIHHVDGDKLNNDKTNLVMLTAGDHTRLHARLNNLQNISGKETDI